MKHLLIAGLITLSFNTIANEKGNGGDARLLGGKYYSLDLVEAGIHKNAFIENYVDYSARLAEEVDKSFYQKEFTLIKQDIKNKIGEIEKIDAIAAHSILLAAKNYQWSFLYDVELIQIHDEFSTVVGDNIQVAIRRNRTIQVNAKIFNLLDHSNKVAFVFHELISALATEFFLINENTKARVLTGSLFNYNLLKHQTDLLRKIICDTIPCTKITMENPSKIYIDQRNLGSDEVVDVISTPKLFVEARGYSYQEFPLNITDIFEEDLAAKACQKIWDISESDFYKYGPLQKLNVRLVLKLEASSHLYSLGFYNYDYTFYTWRFYSSSNKFQNSINQSISQTYGVLGESVLDTGSMIEKEENICIKYRRSKCIEFKTEKRKEFKGDFSIFNKNCTEELKKIQEQRKGMFEKNLVLINE